MTARTIPIARPLIGEAEEQAVLRVLRSGNLAQGAVVRDLEECFADVVGVRHAIAVANGTAALNLALLAHGIGAGDEVITTPFTFIASANAALFVGARPVFGDIEPDSYNLDPDGLESLITPRTRAIMPVHLYGNPADMPQIMAIAERHGLVVVEDAAQAIGASIEGKAVGSFGTGCFSLYPTKNVTAGEGGMITTDDDDVAELARLLRNHGQTARYRHELLGYNLRLTDVHAAIGLAQMERLDDFTRHRRANADDLNRGLAGVVTTPCEQPGYRHVYHQYTIRVPRGARDAVSAHLSERGIGNAIHYPVPVHHQPLYRALGYDDNLPISEQAAREILCLPVHPALSADDLALIVEEVRAACSALA